MLHLPSLAALSKMFLKTEVLQDPLSLAAKPIITTGHTYLDIAKQAKENSVPQSQVLMVLAKKNCQSRSFADGISGLASQVVPRSP